MKHTCISLLTLFMCVSLLGCTSNQQNAQIVATTLPVYEFTTRLCQGTEITVTRLITENVSCLHDYSLQTKQMQAIEAAQTVVISGAGLEAFLEDALGSAHSIIDASTNVELLCNNLAHEHEHEQGHSHEQDPHIWLSPANAKIMSANICRGLTATYPEHAETFNKNLTALEADLTALSVYADSQLCSLSGKNLITFHDGFSYMAEAFGLTIVHAIEEESGSEASAAELIELIQIVDEHQLDAIFTERNGSTAAAEIIAAQTGAQICQLDMCMAGDSYFDAMYRNIDTLKEALE